MKEISLSNSKLKFKVDDEDYVRCKKIIWNLTGGGYAIGVFATESVYLHKFVLWEDREIDHRDNDKTNCQKYNLRVCTRSLNNANARKSKGKSSQYKGVNFTCNKWQASIHIAGWKKHLGTFWTEEEAARAYDIAALQEFGEFAKPNFP